MNKKFLFLMPIALLMSSCGSGSPMILPDADSNYKVSDCEEYLRWHREDNPTSHEEFEAWNYMTNQEINWCGFVMGVEEEKLTVKVNNLRLIVKSSQTFNEGDLVRVQGRIVGVDYVAKIVRVDVSSITEVIAP